MNRVGATIDPKESQWTMSILTTMPPVSPPLSKQKFAGSPHATSIIQPGEIGYSLRKPTGDATMPGVYSSKMINHDQIGQLPDPIRFYQNQISLKQYQHYEGYRTYQVVHIIYWCEHNCSDLFTIFPIIHPRGYEEGVDSPFNDRIAVGFYSDDDAALFLLAIA